MKKHIFAAPLFAILCLLTACDVFEWPKQSFEPVPFVLNLDFSTEMPLYKEVVYTRSDDTRGEDARAIVPPHDIRYTVHVYSPATTKTRSATREPLQTHVFTRSYSDNPDYSVELNLPEGSYEFYVWADYVDAGSKSDKYYTTDDFSAIALVDEQNLPGSNDRRDAFRGSVAANVYNPGRYIDAGIVLPPNEATVQMIRPMGRFEFISTDVELFLSRVISMRGGDAEETTKSGSMSLEQMARSIDLDEFRVVFRYNNFMPYIYNIFTDKPFDSWQNVTFESSMEFVGENMLLGFDYVLVNGSETVMNMQVQVYNKAGLLLSSVTSVMVPVVRSKLTVVKGDFLTVEESGGVVVNPDFDGPDYNIEIK